MKQKFLKSKKTRDDPKKGGKVENVKKESLVSGANWKPITQSSETSDVAAVLSTCETSNVTLSKLNGNKD